MSAWLASWAMLLGLAVPGWAGAGTPYAAPTVAAPFRLLGPGAGYDGPTLASPPDRWIGEDKGRHFAMSFAATGMGYGAARLAVGPAHARSAAVGVAVLLGIGKEVLDARQGRTFSLKDLAWDAAGVTLGYIFVQRIE